MTPDDPRHGTVDQKWRTVAGCACESCEAARAARRRDYKLRRRAHTTPELATTHVERLIRDGWMSSEIAAASGVSAATISEMRRGCYDKVRVTTAVALLGVSGPAPNSWTVPALGTLRRIQALAALGWTVRETCRDAGLSERFYAELVDKDRTTLSRASAESIADVYRQRSMTPPPMNPHRRRTRTIAAKRGWAPPLAWDDIDDPDETPTDWAYLPADRATAIRELAGQGENATQIARRLDMTSRALERWCLRHMPDVWREISRREGDWNTTGNLSHQAMREGAA